MNSVRIFKEVVHKNFNEDFVKKKTELNKIRRTIQYMKI